MVKLCIPFILYLWIHGPKWMRIRPDSDPDLDPHHWFKEGVYLIIMFDLLYMVITHDSGLNIAYGRKEAIYVYIKNIKLAL